MVPRFADVARRNGVGFDRNQLAVYRNGWKPEQNASQDEVNEAPMNAARSQPFLQLAPHKLNAADIQMAGTRRTMCAGFLIRSFFAFYIHLPQVVVPRLDVSSDMIHSSGSMEWESETEEPKNPEDLSPRFLDATSNKRARVETADKGDKGSEAGTAVYGPENKPQGGEQ